MCTVLYEVKKITERGSKAVAVCSTKQKAIAKLKEVVADPPCECPVREECGYDESSEMAFIRNKWGWWADYVIEEIYLDEWID